MNKLVLLTIPALLISAPALAASKADLDVSITAPSGVHVYEEGTFSVTVANVGNRNASSVQLKVQLPVTNTSPTVHIMGTLGAKSPSCTLSGSLLTCSLGTINRGTSKAITFDIELPYSAAALVFDADATTTTAETNLANNSDTLVSSPLTYGVTVGAPRAAENSHCTGTNITSYFECELYPSSISSFSSVLESDGSITITGAPPGTTGTWALTAPDTLAIEYFDGGSSIGTLEARGVSSSCFEGPMIFPGSAYVAIYQVCLQ